MDLPVGLDRHCLPIDNSHIPELKLKAYIIFFRWLHDEATVVSCDADDADPESLIVDIYISEANYRKFLARFGAQQKTAANR
jgi:hypothetical protein